MFIYLQVLGPLDKGDLVYVVGAQESTFLINIPRDSHADRWSLKYSSKNFVQKEKWSLGLETKLGPDNWDFKTELSRMADL